MNSRSSSKGSGAAAGGCRPLPVASAAHRPLEYIRSTWRRVMRRQFFLQVASMLCWVAAVIPASAQHFRLISGSYVQVAAGQSEVWALDAKNQIYRFNATSKTFVKLPGTLTLSKIAVGGGSAMQADQIWGVSPSGSIYRFNAKNNAFGRVTGTMAQIAVGEGDFDSCHPYEI